MLQLAKNSSNSSLLPKAALALLCVAVNMASFSTAAVLAPMVSIASTQPPTSYVPGGELVIGTIVGQAGYQIHIIEIGIGGDADANSGPHRFSLSGGGVDFSWAAGEATRLAGGTAGTPTITLAPSPNAGGSARGFSIQSVNYLGSEGASINLRWDQHMDWDALYALGTDSEGNIYDDSGTPSSARAYVRYELLAVPEPSAALLGGLGTLLLLRRRRA